MPRFLAQVLLLALLIAGLAEAQSRDGLKVFISVDMEGITGVVTCWMLNLRAIAFAAAEGCNVIVCHER